MKTEWPIVRKRRDRDGWIVDLGMQAVTLADGSTVQKRRQIQRDTAEEAQAEAQRQRDLRRRLGALSGRLTDQQVLDAAEAYDVLQGRFSLVYAARFLLERNPQNAVTVAEAFLRLQQQQQAQLRSGELSESHVRGTRSILRGFCEDLADRRVVDVQRSDILAWLRNQTFSSPTTKGNTIRHISLLFGFCRTEQWITQNPCTDVKAPAAKFRSPEFLPVASVERLLLAASKLPDAAVIVPRMAIGFFAGLRGPELDGLDWKDVKLEAGIIAVSEHISKTGIPRPVTIQPVLTRWLFPYRAPCGPIGLQHCAARRHRQAICRSTGIDWVDNAQRHTFATYHLAAFQSAALTAKELGHIGGERLLYRHYAHAGVTKAEADQYWAMLAPSVAPAAIERAG